MSKLQVIFICQKCNAQSPKWSGRCFNCGAWNSLEERAAENKKHKTERETKDFLKTEVRSRIVGFENVKGQETKRIKTGIEEFDRVLGGGIVPGAVILMAGEPGIGKSTLVAQIASSLSGFGNPIRVPETRNLILYISGEESAPQLKLRFDRLNLNTKNLRYLDETEAGMIAAAIEETEPGLVIVDSIQTIHSDEVPSEAGSANQIKISAAKIADAAKSHNIPVIIIGHITKDGKIAGPKTLEHLVDTVLNLEGDKHSASRILRTPKNRFGSTDEIGVFQMKDSGLVEVKNPSELFLEGRSTKPGSIITCVMEGTRPILVEVQALLSRSDFRFPQRRAAGFDLNRLQIIATTLAKRGGLYLFKYDIHLNIVGGLKIKEPFADLAVALAISSAYLNRTVDQKIVAFGEIGLGGEIRPVADFEKRVKEAEKMGFKYIIANPGDSYSSSGAKQSREIEIITAKNINEAMDIIK